jgi:hypothetical protein
MHILVAHTQAHGKVSVGKRVKFVPVPTSAVNHDFATTHIAGLSACRLQSQNWMTL